MNKTAIAANVSGFSLQEKMRIKDTLLLPFQEAIPMSISADEFRACLIFIYLESYDACQPQAGIFVPDKALFVPKGLLRRRP